MKHCPMPKVIISLALVGLAFSACAATPESSPAAAAKVETPVDLQFNNVPLGDAVATLFRGTGRNYTLDPSLQQLRFTGVLKNVSFDTAINGMLKAAGAAYYVDDKGVYHISLPQQIATQGNLALANASTPSAAPPPLPSAKTAESQQIRQQAFNTTYVDPGQIANVLRVTPSVTQVDTPTNGRQIIVSGTDEGIANAAKAIRSLDNEFALPRPVRLKMSAKVTVGTNAGPKTYEASTESVGAEQMPCLLNLDAQMPGSNIMVGSTTMKQPGSERLSLVNATLTPSFVADKIALVGRGHFSCPFGTAPGTRLSKDFDIAASVTPGSPFTVAAGSVRMVFGTVDFAVSVTATPEQGRLPSFQNTIRPNNYYYNNTAPGPAPVNAPKQ